MRAQDAAKRSAASRPCCGTRSGTKRIRRSRYMAEIARLQTLRSARDLINLYQFSAVPAISVIRAISRVRFAVVCRVARLLNRYNRSIWRAQAASVRPKRGAPT
jgi:hypothetical protein